jgi:hypothetical protein
MGEAKRRKQQGLQLVKVLAARVNAGEFGIPGTPAHALVVADKSAEGRAMLAALAEVPAFMGLEALLRGDHVRMWESSELFPYLVLASGSGRPDSRTWLATSEERLLTHVVPAALRPMRARGAAPGLLLGLAPEREADLGARLRALAAA